MKRIYKYPITRDDGPISMPKGAEILTAQAQNGSLQIWAMIEDTVTDKEDRYFKVIGEGWIFFDSVNLKYISTVQFRDGLDVFHVFEMVKC